MELSRIAIIGASSGIGAALAIEMARSGRTIAIVARRSAELQAVARQVEAKGGRAVIEVCDAVDLAAVEGSWRRVVEALGGCDALVYSSGVMPPVGADEYDTAKDKQVIDVNVIGAMAWLNCGARHMHAARAGVLCGIGSVAGDRGRRFAPAYHASKAALATYLESLRNRLSQHGVTVVTIKPGPVRTPLLGDRRMPLTVPAEVAARRVARAIENGEHTVYVHWGYRLIMAVIRMIPSFVFRRLAI